MYSMYSTGVSSYYGIWDSEMGMQSTATISAHYISGKTRGSVEEEFGEESEKKRHVSSE